MQESGASANAVIKGSPVAEVGQDSAAAADAFISSLFKRITADPATALLRKRDLPP